MKELKEGIVFKSDPIEVKTMADRVEARLWDYFKKGNFKPGDVLPKETDIAETLGVSRNVVREALSRFRMLGMIVSRKKRGMVLAVPDVLSGLDRLLDPNLLNESLRKELFELRLMLEVGMADILFVRKTKEDLEALEKIVEKERMAKSDAERVQCDIEFHSCLYQISGNDTLLKFQILLRPIFEHVIKYESKHEPLERGKISHEDLLNILRKENSTSFREAMREHLEPYFKHFF